jgi:hypothetical protein
MSTITLLKDTLFTFGQFAALVYQPLITLAIYTCMLTAKKRNITAHFHIRTVHLDIIKVLFIHQLMH